VKLKRKINPTKALKNNQIMRIKLKNIIHSKLRLKDKIENIQNFYKKIKNKK
jgi:hypothetical protein